MRPKHLHIAAVVVTVVAAFVIAPVTAAWAAGPLDPGQTPDLVTVGLDGAKAGPSSAATVARSANGTLVKVDAAGTRTPVAVVRVPKGRSQEASARLMREN